MKQITARWCLVALLGWLIFLSACTDEVQKPQSVPAPDPTIESLNAQIEKTPNNPALYAQRGQLYYQLGGMDEAIADFKHALQLDSNQVEYWHQLADAYLDYYQSYNALKTMEWAAAKFPQRIPTLLKLAEFQLILKKYEAALRTLERIRKIDPLHTEMFYMFGLVFKEMGKTEQAINAFQSAVEQDADHLDAWLELGQLFAQQKNPIAMRYFDNALRIDAANVMVLHAKAYALANYFDEVEQALEIYRKISRIDPQYPDAYYNAGLLLLDLHKPDEALKQFDLAVQVHPAFKEAWYYRGVAHELLGQLAAAKTDYENALNFDPDWETARQALARIEQQVQ